jgi:hypothetical protein
MTFKPVPAKATARRVTAAAIRLTNNALLARQPRCCERADAISSAGLGAAVHPSFDEMTIFAVQ